MTTMGQVTRSILEPFDPNRHDAGTVAALIYDADPEINAFVFGPRDRAIARIRTLMTLPGTYYTAPWLSCIVSDGRVVGIVAGYPAQQGSVIERHVGGAFVRAFGLIAFVRRLPMFLKLGRILAKRMDSDGYYIVYLSVLATERGKGHGGIAVMELGNGWPTLYLHVATDNLSAIRFYERNGFVALQRHSGKIGKTMLGAIFMARESGRP